MPKSNNENQENQENKVEVRKKKQKSKHLLPPDMKVKLSDDYSNVAGRKKESGTKSGGWYHRKENGISKKTPWLVKGGGGYNVIGGLEKKSVNEIYALREAYAGELYQLFLPKNTPKTRLYIHTNATGDDPKYGLASKELEGFKTITPDDLSNQDFLNKHGKDLVKIVLVAILLGETDLKFENMGIANGKLMKIDHGESLEISSDKQSFNLALEYDHEIIEAFLNKMTPQIRGANGQMVSSFDIEPLFRLFTRDNMGLALAEINTVDVHQIAKVSAKYEPSLSEYREKHQKMAHVLVGNKENTIRDILVTRLTEMKADYIKQYGAKRAAPAAIEERPTSRPKNT